MAHIVASHSKCAYSMRISAVGQAYNKFLQSDQIMLSCLLQKAQKPRQHALAAEERLARTPESLVKLLRTGVILNTENYESCVSFYENVLGLTILFSKAEAEHRLTCFDFGEAYLMVETGGIAKPGGKSIGENCAKLRLHVQNLEAARQHLIAHGIGAEITKFSWGSTINIYDPDGNRIGIREEHEFSEQMAQLG